MFLQTDQATCWWPALPPSIRKALLPSTKDGRLWAGMWAELPAFTTSDSVETVNTTYFQAQKKGQRLQKPILFLLLISSPFISFSPISIFRKRASHFWGAWWPSSGRTHGYTPCFDWDREMQWWGLAHWDPDCQPHHAGGGWGPGLGPGFASQDDSCVFPFCRRKERKGKGVVSSERAILSSPAGNGVLCLLPVCCKPALEIKIAREVIYWQHVLNQAFSEISLRAKLPEFLCPHGLFLLFPELMLSGGVLWSTLSLPGLYAENGNDLMKRCKWIRGEEHQRENVPVCSWPAITLQMFCGLHEVMSSGSLLLCSFCLEVWCLSLCTLGNKPPL